MLIRNMQNQTPPRSQRGFRSNPAFRNNAFHNSAMGYTGADRMTLEGTLTKSTILVLLTIFTAIFEVAMVQTQPQVGLVLGMGGWIAGIVVCFVTIFKPSVAPFTALLYALLEGLMLGCISYFFEKSYPGVVVPAIGLTLFTALAMLVLYRSQVIRVTPMFRKVLFFSCLGIVSFYLLTMLGMFMGYQADYMTHPTFFGIAISLFAIVVGCMSLIYDFDVITQGAVQGAPKYMEWYGAFSILVTLVWLYVEIIRLLAKLKR